MAKKKATTEEAAAPVAPVEPTPDYQALYNEAAARLELADQKLVMLRELANKRGHTRMLEICDAQTVADL